MDYLEQNHIRFLPALPPDLSPIEHFWDQLVRRVQEIQIPPETLQDLLGTLILECNSIQPANIMILCRRCEAGRLFTTLSPRRTSKYYVIY